jgi:hypothetical protein
MNALASVNLRHEVVPALLRLPRLRLSRPVPCTNACTINLPAFWVVSASRTARSGTQRAGSIRSAARCWQSRSVRSYRSGLLTEVAGCGPVNQHPGHPDLLLANSSARWVSPTTGGAGFKGAGNPLVAVLLAVAGRSAA